MHDKLSDFMVQNPSELNNRSAIQILPTSTDFKIQQWTQASLQREIMSIDTQPNFTVKFELAVEM